MYGGHANDRLEDVWLAVKLLGLLGGLVGFVFKFGNNRTNFDFSNASVVCGRDVVSVRERCPSWCLVRHPCRIRSNLDVSR